MKLNCKQFIFNTPVQYIVKLYEPLLNKYPDCTPPLAQCISDIYRYFKNKHFTFSFLTIFIDGCFINI